MTNTTNLTPESIMAAAAKAQASKSVKALAALWQDVNGLESLADSKALETRIGNWRAGGAVLAAAVGLAAPGTDLHTVAQDDIVKAAAAAGITVVKDRAKKLLRADLYVTPELLADAKDTFGKANGPRTLEALDVVRWCQAHDSKGRAQLKGLDGLSKAAAVKAVSKAALETADATAKAKADADRAAKAAKGAAILADADDTVYGPMTAARWVALSADGLDEVIALAQGLKAAKAAKAKADKAAKAKAPKAKAADKAPADAAAPLPGTDEFAAAVAAAVAAALAAHNG